MTTNLIVIVMFALYLTMYEIFANQMQIKFDFDNGHSQGSEKCDLRYLNVRFYIGDF